MRKNYLFKRIGAMAIAAAVMASTVQPTAFVTYSTVKAAETEEESTATVLKAWNFTTGVDGWSYGTGWEYMYDGADNSSVSWDDGKLKATVDFSANADQSWSQMALSTWVNNSMDLSGGNLITFDYYYDTSCMSQGSIMFKLFSNGASLDKQVTFDDSAAETVEGTIKKASIAVDIDELTGEDVESVNDFAICVVGNQTDYKGDIWFDNIKIVSTTKEVVPLDVVKQYTFDNSTESWYYGTGWEYNYTGAANSSVAYSDGKLKVNCDFSNDSAQSWSQLAVCVWESNGLDLTGCNAGSVDFYYDKTLLTSGSFKLKLYSNGGIESSVDVDLADAEEVEGTDLIKVPVNFYFETLTDASSVNDISICIVGNCTDYKGALYLDNVKLLKDESVTSSYVNSTIEATGAQYKQSIENGVLTTYDADGNEVKTTLATAVPTVDQDATDDVKQVYAYLKAIGSTDTTIFGHQDDTFAKAGSSELSTSDTYDVTGAYAGVWGIDSLALAGQEYSASRYNNEYCAKTGNAKVPETKAGHVMAAAAMTNDAIESGAIVTLSCHMPNFSKVTAGNYDGVHSYTKYNFEGYTVNDLTGDTMNQMLPGGKYNDMFNAYLDMVADYCSQVDGAILFRPFHENTGAWFWWGSSCCDPETYKNVFRYTVEYLRDTKDIHNILYEYGPSCEAESVADYEVRYPGDEYVDLVGFDMYNNEPKNDDTWINSLKAELQVVGDFAAQHNKLFAVTETGMAAGTDKGDNQTAVHRTGNKDKDWYNKVLNAVAETEASYFLLWANFSEIDGFYTPYVKSVNEDGSLYGHELLDYFIDFYNDPRSAFTTNMKDALTQLKDVQIDSVAISDAVTGYITSPVSGSRILEATDVTAKLSNIEASDVVEISFNGAAVAKVTATTTDGSVYTARLDADTLASLGEAVGTMSLIVNGETIQTINATYNIPEPVVDPLVVDNFEDYYGVQSLLTKAWTTNKATGNAITLELTNEAGTYYDGSYGLKFTYDETSDGWAGATIAKEANWAGCNALQLWTIPDGNNQKTVVQITANNTVYEVYLNKYTEYVDATTPMLITIPFSEFCERDTAGNPTGNLVNDAYAISSIGLWVNALDGTPAVVDGKVSGTIYYDAVKAVTTDSSTIVFEDASVDAPVESETPATSEAPVVSETPATSEAPVVSETPATSEAPVVSETPATSEAPVVSETPATSEAPATSTAPVTVSPKVSVTTNASGTVSQVYTITNAGTEAFDLSKLSIRYNYTKDDVKEQSFWCDNAGHSLNVAPYYANCASNVVGTFGDGYLDVTFKDSYEFVSGTLSVQVRFNNSDWSSYTNFKSGSVEVYYDGQLIDTL